jgi:hypothetical protein
MTADGSNVGIKTLRLRLHIWAFRVWENFPLQSCTKHPLGTPVTKNPDVPMLRRSRKELAALLNQELPLFGSRASIRQLTAASVTSKATYLPTIVYFAIGSLEMLRWLSHSTVQEVATLVYCANFACIRVTVADEDMVPLLRHLPARSGDNE